MGGKRYEFAPAVEKYCVAAYDQPVNVVTDERRESIFDLAGSGYIQDRESNAKGTRNNLQFSRFSFRIRLVCRVSQNVQMRTLLEPTRAELGAAYRSPRY
jgi:hypothetical protein